MESFTLLKYWRTSGATGGGGAAPLFATSKAAAAAIPFTDYGFDGPYFDLEFTLTDETSETTETESGSYAEDFSENESEKDGELRSPHTKFRVLSLKSNSSNRLLEERENQGRDRERGPLVSLFAIDKANHQGIELRHSMQNSDRHSSSDDRNLAKEVLQKYLNMLKPLYVGVEKMRFPAGQGKVMRKHLSKSRSTSAVSPPPGNRRDHSMLELQDGIEGAILHCKRSFNSDREGESANFLAP